MKSETITVQSLFQDRRQYRVPFYQRAYVWGKEEQWQPLWTDIVDKADTRLGGEAAAPHFLGAIVLEPQKRQGLMGVETYHIIDGQQRLTTLQYLLVALGMAVRETSASPILPLIEGCIWNPNPETMERKEIELFKVWPTFRDRAPYEGAMQAISREELKSKFPASFTQNGSLRKIGVDHPLALEAIWFFREQIEVWIGSANESAENVTARRLESLAEAVLRDLKLVSISLEEGDDAQVIFETLNGRGAELHATDLIRNFIFMRADREGADAATLYNDLWSPFESSFWIEEQRRGRLRRPRLEWFVQTSLQAELAEEVDIGRIYAGYRRFAIGRKDSVPAETQLQLLTKYADQYRQFVNGAGSDPIAQFGRRIAAWDASPTHALALRIASSGQSAEEQARMYNDIVSYIVRRAVCGLTIKNYNNIFLQLLKRIGAGGTSADALRAALSSLDGNASRWPRDDEFRHAWLTESAHARLAEPARLRAVLSELENGMRTARTEEPFVATQSNLDVDHIMPDRWYEHWQLDGEIIRSAEANATLFGLFGEAPPSPRAQAIVRREKLKATFGNLTLVHYGINRSLQHAAFPEKRERFFAESNLHLNRGLMLADRWDEASIEERGRALFDIARLIWQGPSK